MNDGSGLARRSIDRRSAARLGAALGAILVLGALLAQAIRPNPQPSPPLGTPVAQASPSRAPSALPAPTPTAEPWQELRLDPAVVVAVLAPEHSGPAGVGLASRFTLRSLNGVPAATLAAGIHADPPVEFRIVRGADETEAILEPKAALLEGTTYRLTLDTPDGALGGSWAFRTDRPLQVVGTLPGDVTTGVPIDTGIEITFDQDGSIGVEGRFHVEPQVPGRLEQHGRTWSFVPASRLSPATAYRVTIDAGVAIQGSTQVLEAPISFRFETEASAATPEWEVAFAGPMAAIKPSERPVLPLFGSVDDEESEQAVPPPNELAVEIFRLPDLASTLAAAATLTGPDSWLRLSRGGIVDTSRFVRVASVEAALRVDRDHEFILEIPVRLDAGAYLVEVPGGRRPAQVLLQVRTLAVYAVSSETDVVAWVNDLDTVTPIEGATVALRDGRVMAATDTAGIARFATPEVLRPNPNVDEEVPPSLISITAPDGSWMVAALGSRTSTLQGRYDNRPSDALSARSRWWLLFDTDRSQYRESDVVHVWGLLRERDGGAVPANAEVRLRPAESESAAAIQRVTIHPNARGVFVADVPFRDLPRGAYSLDLVVDGVVVESRWIDVAVIRKPSYEITVTTDRHAFLDGDTIDVRIKATFFDGSIVPRMQLNVRTNSDDFTSTVTTDATGAARVAVPAHFFGESRSDMSSESISVTPARPEEGEISGSASVLVFPSKAWLTQTATLAGTSLVVKGTLELVDFAGIDATFMGGDWWWPNWEDIGNGVVAGRSVSAQVTRLHEVRTVVGQEYDYLEKRVVTIYGYDTVRSSVGTFRTTSAADGTFRIALTVPSAADGYDVVVSASDADGRGLVGFASAWPSIDVRAAQQPSYLVRSSCGSASITADLGGVATVTMHDGDGRVANDGRFLFIVANRGIRDAVVGATSTYDRPLTVDDLPGYTIRAVQVTAAGYTNADAGVDVDTADLALDVQVRSGRAHYQPGDQASVEITTLGPDGLPIAADVVVQVVDEKLFAIGAAFESDVLQELLAATGSGFLQSFTSHHVPVRDEEGGCGGEGGAREAFGDVVTFQLVHTGSDGRATASFKLLDDLTSWHVTALALAGGVRAGSASVLIPVSLPFFVEAVLAPEYLVGDEPVLRVRAYGDALAGGDAVRFSVSAPSLGISDRVVEGKAFEASGVALPKLPAGSHRIRIEATGPGGRTDAIIRTIHVVSSRLAATVTRYDTLTASFSPQGGSGLTSYTIVDAGRGALISDLRALAEADSARFDRGAAAEVARRILIDEYGFSDSDIPKTGFDAARYEQSGIALLPYASRDPELSALAALIVPGLINQGELREYLLNDAGADESPEETHLMVLAGLAGLGDDVLEDLHARAAEPRSVRESLWLGIGLAAIGDEDGARAIEHELLAAHGQRFGPWVRLGVGSNIEDTLDTSRLLLVLTARLGDPIARDVRQYLADNPSNEQSLALEELAYIQSSLDRLPRGAGRVAWTVDGARHVVELEPGGAFTLALTPAQRATLELEPLAGKLAVVTSWTGSRADVPTGGPVTISRIVTPATNAPADLLVRVRITVEFEAGATSGCWQITDLAPSGLVPIERNWEWPDAEIGPYIHGPYQIDGQRVHFCAYTAAPGRTFEYVARVVSPGSYAWEPAVIQSVEAPELGASTSGFTFTIN